MYMPLTIYNSLHKNVKKFISNDDLKHTITDQNHLPYAVKYNLEIPYLIAVADENGNIKIFKTYPKFELIKEENIYKNCIYDLIWLNKHDIACGGGDKIVNIIDINTFETKSILKGHTESVKTLSCVKTNTSIIASGSRDGSILIYDLRYNKKTSDESYHSINTIQVAHYNAGQMPNISTPKTKNHHHHHSSNNNNNNNNISPIASVLFQNEYLIISAGATDNLIKVWDLRKTYSNRMLNPQPLYSFKNEITTKGYSSLCLTNCYRRMFANCMNNTIYEFDLTTYKLKQDHIDYNLHKNNSNFVKSCLSIDDNFLLTGSSDSNAYIYPLNYRNRLNAIKLENAHQNEVTCVAWSPHDINQLITCSDDNSIRVWNVKSDLSSIEKQENLFKANEIESSNNNNSNECGKQLTTIDENFKFFNQKFYYNKQFLTTNVYNDYLFTNYHTKCDFNFRKLLKSMDNSNKQENKVCFKSPTNNLPMNISSSAIVKQIKQKNLCLPTPKNQQLSLMQMRIPFKSNENTPKQLELQQQHEVSLSTSKKRSLDKIFDEALNLNAHTPPASKRRLILDQNNTNRLQQQQQQQQQQQNNSKSMTILDYFSPKMK